MINGVEGLCVVNSDCGRAGGGLPLVEAYRDGRGKGQEGRGSGVVRLESVLGGVCGEGGGECGKEKPFQDLCGWAKEGNWAIGGAPVGWLASFQEGNDDSVLPKGWKARGADGEVINFAEVGDA